MDTYSRHIFSQVTNALLLILVSLTMVVWMATALKQLKLVTSQGQSFILFLKMTMLALPSLMGFIAPMALLIACLHILNRVNGDSELIVLNAGGATIWRIAKPYLAMSLIVAGMLFVVNLYVQPYSLRTLQDYVVQVRTDLISQVLQPGQFTSPEKGLIFHIRERDNTGDLLGLAIHDTRDKKQTMTYLAERGRIQKSGDDAFLIMLKGHIQRKTEKGEGTQIIAFQQYMFDLNQFGPEQNNKKISYRPRESYIGELLKPDPKNVHFRQEPGKFRTELHERFVSPLYTVLFAMIAVAMIGQVRSTRQKSLSGVFAAFGLAVLFKILGVAASNLVTKSAAMVPLVYLLPIAGFVLTALWAQKSMGYSKRN